MHQEILYIPKDKKSGEKPEKLNPLSENESDPESDTPADVTPRNIDPSDKNSAEPDIKEPPHPAGAPPKEGN